MALFLVPPWVAKGSPTSLSLPFKVQWLALPHSAYQKLLFCGHGIRKPTRTFRLATELSLHCKFRALMINMTMSHFHQWQLVVGRSFDSRLIS
jgi:hypothetical protein